MICDTRSAADSREIEHAAEEYDHDAEPERWNQRNPDDSPINCFGRHSGSPVMSLALVAIRHSEEARELINNHTDKSNCENATKHESGRPSAAAI
jgi:hypothetical protein